MTTPRFELLACAVIVAALGCAVPAVQSERGDDGVYHFKCALPLPQCLRAAEAACNYQRYAVLRAFDDHNLKGDNSQPADTRSSEAFVRCDALTSWSPENRALRDSTLAAAAPAPAPALVVVPSGGSAPGCVPGATQACVGPGACAGGQACAPDGKAFGPCDCGGVAKPAAPSVPQ
jgi:hypothetical protein